MTLDISLPQAIFFDWDGTLVDSYDFLMGAHNHVRAALGLPPFTGDEFKNYFGHPREKLYAQLYGNHIEQAKTLFGEYVVRHHVAHLRPMPGAGELLALCAELGLGMGVISNKKAEYLHLEIAAFGWGLYFKTVLGAGDSGNDKPAPDPLLKAVREGGYEDTNSIWYVGDTDVDLRCARSAGCPAVFMAHDSKSAEWIDLYKPFLIFQNCDGLREFLLQMDKNRIKAEMG